MCKKLVFLFSFILLLGLANRVSAALVAHLVFRRQRNRLGRDAELDLERQRFVLHRRQRGQPLAEGGWSG